jgi:hypothetical protein
VSELPLPGLKTTGATSVCPAMRSPGPKATLPASSETFVPSASLTENGTVDEIVTRFCLSASRTRNVTDDAVPRAVPGY